MAGAETRVAPLFHVAHRPAESPDQEVTETRFRACHVVGRIHRSEDVVTGHLSVEGANEPRESVLPDLVKHLQLIGHGAISSVLRASRLTARGARR